VVESCMVLVPSYTRMQCMGWQARCLDSNFDAGGRVAGLGVGAADQGEPE
jgi:hypothetical protein